ncbi:hypothetical protein [Streptomyces sp. NBC_00096]|uniref:hypothetical protein n=1 Tax=Streptomyces sp. NBC_00096 TaxID=2975650 RepID=UPI0032474ED8
MTEFVGDAIQPGMNTAQMLNGAFQLLPPVGTTTLDKVVNKDGFGSGTTFGRHPVKKATNLFKIQFTYSKNRSALVTINPITAGKRAVQRAATNIQKVAHQAMYSKDDAVVQGDKHKLEQFELHTRFVVPMEMTFDLTPFERKVGIPYDEYKIDREGAAQRGEPIAPYDGPVLSDYLQITTLDIHLGSHVNSCNANSEPLKVTAEVFPDDHADGRESRYIRVLLHIFAPGLRGLAKVQEDYEIKFKVSSDFTWDVVYDEIPEDWTEQEKAQELARREELEAHIEFRKPKNPKVGSVKRQKALQKRGAATKGSSFVLDPTIPADQITEEQLAQGFRQIFDLAVNGKLDAAEKALELLAEQTNTGNIGLGFLLTTHIRKFGLTTFPQKFMDANCKARPVLEWINQTMGPTARLDQVIDLIVAGGKGRANKLQMARKALEKEFQDNKNKKINFLLKAAAARGMVVVPQAGVTLRELFDAIADAYGKTAETTTLSKADPGESSSILISNEQIPLSTSAEWCRKIGGAFGGKNPGDALDFLDEYTRIPGSRARTMSEALLGLLQDCGISDAEVTLPLMISSMNANPTPQDIETEIDNVIAALSKLHDRMRTAS